MENTNNKSSFEFTGSGGEFFGIWIVNILLSIVTLGIYSAWAKVRTKRYLYGNTNLSGDGFDYHATPIQILKGRLVAFAVVVLWVISSNLFPVFSLILLLGFYAAVPYLIYSNSRFDAAMTSYRNVRFSFTGTVKEAYVALLGRGLAVFAGMAVYFVIVALIWDFSPVIAGIMGCGSLILAAVLYGWVIAGIQSYYVNNHQYGNWKFSADITKDFFIKTYLKVIGMGILGAILLSVSVGIFAYRNVNPYAMSNGGMDFSSFAVFIYIYIAYFALFLVMTAYTAVRTRNHIFSLLSLSSDQQTEVSYQFNSTLTVRGYIKLVLTNFLLQVFTLGIARPWAIVRSIRYVATNTEVIGDTNLLSSTGEEPDNKSAIADELAETFELGIGLS